MKYHPLADIFPLIEGSDYDALVADIKANGLLEPIWIYEDKILDGRNRWRACKDAKIEPKTREYKGKDALGFIVSLNLKRRHLNESQRGMVGARIANLGEGRPDKTTAPNDAVSQPKAAELLNVSRKSVQRAKQVIERGTPELVKAVDSGRMPVSVAERLTKATPQKQREVAKEYETKATATELKAHVALATGENEWYTPPEYIAAARKVMGGIDCDPASSEKANKTVKADTFFTQENEGLSQKWTKNEWINPCVCSCGIHPHILYLSHETKAMPYLRKALFGEHKKNVPDVHANNSFARDENMHEMFKGISEHAGVFSRKATQGKVVFRLLQELLPRDSSAETGSSPERPNRTDKSVGRKATIQSKSKGNRTQENTESDSQSYSQTEKNEQGVFLESCSMGASPVRVGAQVRVLWSGNDIDTGSFYSALTSGLSGNSSMEYDSLLLEVQLTKGINSSERLVGFGAICPHCGKTGVVVSSPASIFCNPPYAQPLVSHFSDAVVKKFKSEEIDEACILVNNATETAWFQNMAECSSAICFPKGRVRFLDQNGNPGAPLQGQAVIYLGKNADSFCKSFEKFGTTWKR